MKRNELWIDLIIITKLQELKSLEKTTRAKIANAQLGPFSTLLVTMVLVYLEI